MKGKHRWLVRVYVEGVIAHEHETLSYFTSAGIRKFYNPNTIDWIKGPCEMHFISLNWSKREPTFKVSFYV
jgi:hypothetical protein